MQNYKSGLCLLLALLCTACDGAGEAQQGQGQQGGMQQQGKSCPGKTYFSCICPGDQVCPREDGEYDFPISECESPLNVTPQNIDNLVGSLQLKDPPCEDPQNCRRVSVRDSSSAPANDPNCRCREKISVCEPKT
jgi:hypothetical protein